MPPVLIISRPAPQGPAFAARLTAMMDTPPEVIFAPAFAIEATGAEVPTDGDVIFTSAIGVAHAPDGKARTAWCVGDATAQAARARNYTAKVGRGDAKALVALILSHSPDVPLIHLAGAHRRGDVAENLRAAGLICETVVLYRQVPLAAPPPLIRAAAANAPMIAPIFSPRSASILHLPGRVAPLHVIAISDAVADAADACHPDQITIAPTPDADSMLSVTRKVWFETVNDGNA